ncbi:putative WD repeat-containing protein [Wickerhamomyces ciferrii]|uniref:WD repeat-containing protein n=1 Tax=Wickerhamomyces ciferrii (strain ATCC 14091 / BCRC 22168 / CBS 111 / JCM 3599 / NBRC 0793 / NRRL Y-1031 F-60-10) TaxID=1206466 RepID=K0KVK4_WICCF|nr:putative WD repeat-containing protein [Wickerhamomyces ciferrii]CCH45173.1 putative WD repeat-containing protein [Wickerhamomyces ciferrii]
MSVKLNHDSYIKLKPSKKFEPTNPETCITSLDFDDSGQYLISSLTSESINLYDAYRGTYNKPIYSKKYGCHLARFTHQQKNCVYASTKEDNTIRYLSLNDNSYIRYFKGHKALVNSLEVSPRQNIFASASLDDTFKIWDLRTSTAQFSLPSKHSSFVSFDPTGDVVAIASQSRGIIDLKPIEMLHQLPCASFEVPQGFNFNKVEFSNDNRYILVCSTNQNHLLLDSFDGNLVCELGPIISIPGRSFPDTGNATFSPCGNFVFSGNGDGKIAVWDLTKKSEINDSLPKFLTPKFTLTGDVKPRMLSFNPKYLQLITADSQLTMWTPELD